ncbi:MAG: chromosome segregation protein SMC [Xenococcaceae cyanobacterium MO_188.B32]|nr:chromosome segregation protein SMC [Xenococcaceae cyanobacterium MO_188.B32]
MDNISNYLNFIQQEVVAEEKTVKVARLIILLIKIEKELYTVKTTLGKLKNHEKADSKSTSENTVDGKLATVEMLLDKIRKARLNLNYYFI